jgi:hypothetical protein
MRNGRILVLILLGGLFWASHSSAQAEEKRPYAAQVEAYIGGAVFDLDNFDDESGITVGGTGSAVGLLGPAYLQLDTFGDYTDPDPEFTNAGVAGHLGITDPELGMIGITGGYNHLDLDVADGDFVRVGGEAEAYVDRVTLGMDGGVFGEESSDIDDFYYVRGLLRAYPIQTLKLEGIGGYADLGEDVGLARISIEFRPEAWWASFFVRWEAEFEDDLDQHAAVVGVRLLFDDGLSLMDSDRVYFRERCLGILIGARLC